MSWFDARRLSVVASAFSPDPREAAAAARRNGFAGAQFDAASASLDLTALSRTGQREFLHVLSAQNCLLSGLRVDLGVKGVGPGADIDRVLSRLGRVLETAAGLATPPDAPPLLCIELGPIPEPPPAAATKPAITSEMAGAIFLPSFAAAPAPEISSVPLPAAVDPVFSASVDGALAELGAMADRFNVVVALRSELASLAALERVLTAARCSWFGVDLDPVSLLRDAWDADQAFSHLGPQLRHVRGRDAVVGADRRTKAMTIGRGDTRWDRLLDNLEGAGFTGWITIDPLELTDRPAAAVAGRKYLEMHAT